MKLYDKLDIRKNELLNSTAQIVDSFPANAREGQFVYHSIFKSMCVCIDATGDTTQVTRWRIFISGNQDNTISGITCTSSEEVLDAVYVIGNNEVRSALAANVSTANVCGFIISKESSTKCTIRTSGLVVGFNGSGLTAGKQYFLSRAFNGGITDTPPVGFGEVLIRVGIGFSSDTLYVEIDRTLVIRA